MTAYEADVPSVGRKSEVELATSRDRLSAFGEQLEALWTRYEAEYVPGRRRSTRVRC